MIHVADSDLGNPSYVPGSGYPGPLGIGYPEIWGGGNAPFPIYTSVSYGTLGYGSGNPCAVAGQCVAPAEYVINSGPIF